MILVTNGSSVMVTALADKLLIGTVDSSRPSTQTDCRPHLIDHRKLEEAYSAPPEKTEASLQENGQATVSTTGKKLVAHNSGIKSYKPDVENTRWISAVAISLSGTFIAVVDNLKDLFVYTVRNNSESLDRPKLISRRNIPKRCMAITFTSDEASIIVADKLGDAYIFSISADTAQAPAPILGHISVLTDVVVSPDDRYILTSDRDEKIRVSHFPLADDIQTFCLGHTEFVCRILIPSPDHPVVLSTSGDCTVKAFNYLSGSELTSVSLLEEGPPNPSPGTGVYVNSLSYSPAIRTVFTSLRSKNFVYGLQLHVEADPDLKVAFLPLQKIAMTAPVVSIGLLGMTLLILLEDPKNPFTTLMHIDQLSETGSNLQNPHFSGYEEALRTVVQDIEQSGQFTNLFRDPFADMFNMFSRGSEVESEHADTDSKKGFRKEIARQVSPAYRPNTKRVKTDVPETMEYV
ncbi:hypothetical protein RvY_15587 [Ramazzottius varieornatus]|uniref:tRNA (guanine-N(7)-)-methyltransferase non-catalytic subunit n=1 Tax=Ramazzottius varieornatus TaxID=947166 RepID=A0A1D1VVF5_RAMVA|nr:hypothetical protein RvY_15587 [Ramazzottius varieornatus]